MGFWRFESHPTPPTPATLNAPTLPDPVAWARSSFNFDPDPRQAEVLRCTSSNAILCCSRQWGKSTITAIKALHHAWFHPGSLILVAAPTLRQSGEWLAKTTALLRLLHVKPRGDGHNENSLLLPNGSRLVGLPGVADNIRGFSAVSLLLVDEAAYVPDPLFHALYPMLAVSAGSLWVMSTPNGQSGFFYDAWHAPASEWTRFRIPATECPRISPAFLERQRLAFGDQVFRREYLCEFLASDSQILSRELIDEAFVDNPPFNQGRPLWRL